MRRRAPGAPGAEALGLSTMALPRLGLLTRLRVAPVGAARSGDVLQVLQQHNARVNKQGIAAAQQRLREHKAPQAAAAQFCAAGEATRAAAPASTQGGGDESDEQLLALLKQHNAKAACSVAKGGPAPCSRLTRACAFRWEESHANASRAQRRP